MGIKPIGVSEVSEGAAFEKELVGVESLASGLRRIPKRLWRLNRTLLSFLMTP
ncbi:hypothetical protein MHI37_03215 [Paenibacillus sp. FSL H8-0548]|uniref:hypothetical protein n=1 Tax=Paenibacillus sp. FSL H8-0548 TaxID=1920422 RepID=UPI0015C3A9C5|nr:hypothetical protein [Paenibacillus sp. FSL H8-0548]